jgi:hypothetical protein
MSVARPTTDIVYDAGLMKRRIVQARVSRHSLPTLLSRRYRYHRVIVSSRRAKDT